MIALLTGASVIARDLADGRLAFFFARPVPWWAIAGGKLLAAALLTAAAAAVAATPAVLREGGVSGFVGSISDLLTRGGLVVLLLSALALIGLGHAASVVYRSRSPWVALDLGLFGLSIAGGAALFRALVRWGSLWFDPSRTSRFWLVALLLLAVVTLVPAAAQVAWGRSDIRRGHRVLSATLWSGVFALFALAGGLLARELALTPADFESRVVWRASSDGRYVALSGFQERQRGRGRHLHPGRDFGPLRSQAASGLAPLRGRWAPCRMDGGRPAVMEGPGSGPGDPARPPRRRAPRRRDSGARLSPAEGATPGSRAHPGGRPRRHRPDKHPVGAGAAFGPHAQPHRRGGRRVDHRGLPTRRPPARLSSRARHRGRAGSGHASRATSRSSS